MSSDPSNPSTTSLQSAMTVTSTSPLNQTKAPPKDYSAAFATLQSRYGTGGHIPTPKPDKSKLSEAQTSPNNALTSDTTLTTESNFSGSANTADSSKKKKGLFQKLKGKVKRGT
ncbi:hypothetical protein BDZ94DRAFT_525981 [Collybia nuda]|uniref:Uncharacterized protein n=1 Tax=Collybia nuda TaxID=64659 RepID=A0A9P5Y8M5_9AGAR|nr:hypothetical protein BDZ94DRAFT_525981 [Collybia nuda]